MRPGVGQRLVVADPEEEGTNLGLSVQSKLQSWEGPEEGLTQKLIGRTFHEFMSLVQQLLLLSGRCLHTEPPVSGHGGLKPSECER